MEQLEPRSRSLTRVTGTDNRLPAIVEFEFETSASFCSRAIFSPGKTAKSRAAARACTRARKCARTATSSDGTRKRNCNVCRIGANWRVATLTFVKVESATGKSWERASEGGPGAADSGGSARDRARKGTSVAILDSTAVARDRRSPIAERETAADRLAIGVILGAVRSKPHFPLTVTALGNRDLYQLGIRHLLRGNDALGRMTHASAVSSDIVDDHRRASAIEASSASR